MLTVKPLAAVLLADNEARFREVNDAAIELLKYSKEQLLSMHVWDITAPAQHAEARSQWQAFIKAGTQAGVYQIRRADGRRVTVHYEAVANVRPGRHVSVIRPVSPSLAESRPLDECPFERPFTADFDQCATYQPLITRMADSQERPVQPVWTCEHLLAANIAGQHRYYGRCGLGDAIDRSTWLELASKHHLLEVRRLRIDFYRRLEGALKDLIEAKMAAFSPAATGPDHERLAAGIANVVKSFETFSKRNRQKFAAAELDAELLRDCLKATLNHFRRERSYEAFQAPADLLSRYPLTVQAFLRPDLVAAQLSSARV